MPITRPLGVEVEHDAGGHLLRRFALRSVGSKPDEQRIGLGVVAGFHHPSGPPVEMRRDDDDIGIYNSATGRTGQPVAPLYLVASRMKQNAVSFSRAASSSARFSIR